MQRFVLAGLGIFLAVLVLEVGVREVQPEPQHAQEPGVTVSLVGPVETRTPIPPHVGNAGLRVSQDDKVAVATVVTSKYSARASRSGLVGPGGMSIALVFVVVVVGVVAGGRVLNTRRNI